MYQVCAVPGFAALGRGRLWLAAPLSPNLSDRRSGRLLPDTLFKLLTILDTSADSADSARDGLSKSFKVQDVGRRQCSAADLEMFGMSLDPVTSVHQSFVAAVS